jgi:hypothetical protein
MSVAWCSVHAVPPNGGAKRSGTLLCGGLLVDVGLDWGSIQSADSSLAVRRSFVWVFRWQWLEHGLEEHQVKWTGFIQIR